MAAARHGAARVWATDVAATCTRFTEFNCRLNGVDNVTSLTSDVYGELQGLTFDRIVCHPPYVPSILPRWVFYSGGEDGEQITRRVVEGLPDHLKPGGLAFVLSMGSDRKAAPFEERARAWLGDRAEEFDVAFLVTRTLRPSEFAAYSNPHVLRTREEFQAFDELFARLQVENLQQGLLLFQRRNGRRHTFTVRRDAGKSFRREHWEWLLAWESEAVGERRMERFLDTPLHSGSGIDFEVSHRLENDQWSPTAYRLEIHQPFEVECEAAPWMANLIAICDGKTTAREHLKVFQRHGVLPASLGAAEFAKAIKGLMAGGFIEVEGFRPPRAGE